LTQKQLKEALKILGFKLSNDEIKSLTPTPISTVSLTSFCDIIATKKKDEKFERDQSENAFELFDLEKKGFIDFADLQRVAKLIGEDEVTDQQLQNMIRYADRKNNNFVTKEDFLFILNRINNK